MFIFVIVVLMLLGVLLGYIIRKKRLLFVHRIVTLLIWSLLFLLGVEVGSNKMLVNSLSTIGLEAIIITLAAVFGSVFASWMLWLSIQKKQKRADRER